MSLQGRIVIQQVGGEPSGQRPPQLTLPRRRRARPGHPGGAVGSPTALISFVFCCWVLFFSFFLFWLSFFFSP